MQQQYGLIQTGNNRTSVEKCNNHNATAEKQGWYKKFPWPPAKFPNFPWLSRSVGTLSANEKQTDRQTDRQTDKQEINDGENSNPTESGRGDNVKCIRPLSHRKFNLEIYVN